MPFAPTDHQLPHLANGTFQALRKGWRTRSSDLSPSPFSSIGSGRIPRPETAGSVIINGQTALQILPPQEHIGMLHYLAVEIDHDMHEKFCIELIPSHETEWRDAITDPGNTWTAWRWRADRETWRPHPALHHSVPETALKLAKYLLVGKLIWPLTTAQLRVFEEEMAAMTKTETAADTIERALTAGMG